MYVSMCVNTQGYCLCTHPTPRLSFLLLIAWTDASVHAMQLETLLSFVRLCSWQRSTSLEVPVTARECVSDVQSSRLSPSLVCTRRKRRSQSIPAELAVPSNSSHSERPAGCTHSLEAGAANKVTLHYCMRMWSQIIIYWQEMKLDR